MAPRTPNCTCPISKSMHIYGLLISNIEENFAQIHVPNCSGWNCQPWPSRSQNWMFVYFIIILSHSQQFPTSSSHNQVELGEWATGHFMHCNW